MKSCLALFAANMASLSLQFLSLHLYAEHFDDGSLADYLTVLAASMMLSPIITLGLCDAILYFVGREGVRSTESFTMLLTAALTSLCTSITVSVLILCFPRGASEVVFGQSTKGDLVVATVGFVVSRSAFTVVFRYLTALRSTLVPCLLQIAVFGVVPVVVIAINTPHRLCTQLWEMAGITILLLCGVGISEAHKTHFMLRHGIVSSKLNAMLMYGIQRMPVVLGMACLLSVPTLVSNHLGCSSLEIIALGGALSVLRLLSISQRITTYVMLPRLAWAKENNPSLMISAVRGLTTMAIVVGAVGGLVAMFLGDYALAIILKRAGIQELYITWPFWIACAPLVAVFFFRPVIDAIHQRGYNTIAVVSALILGTALLLFLRGLCAPALAVGLSFLFAVLVLCGASILTLRALTKNYGPSGSLWEIRVMVLGVLACLVFGGLLYALDSLVAPRQMWRVSLVGTFSAAVVFFAIKSATRGTMTKTI